MTASAAAPAPAARGGGRGAARESPARRTARAACATAFRGGWGARLAYRLGLQGALATTVHRFPVASRPASAPPLRVAFASDFHAGATTHPALLAEACRRLTDARPDVILLGGDFAEFNACDAEPLIGLLADVAAPLGTYAVLGNHDRFDDDTHVVGRLEAAGVEVLLNRGVRLAPPHDDVWVCGLDDPIWGAPDAERALDGADGTRIVLMHAPDGLLALGGRPFDVALCGHTHGGQVAAPWGWMPCLPIGRLSRRFPRGVYTLPGPGERRLVVSHGVGCSTVPLRVFARPEVHVCEVVSAR
jgi:hypothetical protein